MVYVNVDYDSKSFGVDSSRAYNKMFVRNTHRPSKFIGKTEVPVAAIKLSTNETVYVPMEDDNDIIVFNDNRIRDLWDIQNRRIEVNPAFIVSVDYNHKIVLYTEDRTSWILLGSDHEKYDPIYTKVIVTDRNTKVVCE